MRIAPSPTFGLLGVLAGFVATFAIAGTVAQKPAPAPAPHACCVATASHHARRHAHAWNGRHAFRGSSHYGYVSGVEASLSANDFRVYRDWNNQPGWSEDNSRWGYVDEQRPWASDRYGFLTWPGKTHFVDGRVMENAPPPEGWRPPPPPEGEESYELYRY